MWTYTSPGLFAAGPGKFSVKGVTTTRSTLSQTTIFNKGACILGEKEREGEEREGKECGGGEGNEHYEWGRGDRHTNLHRLGVQRAVPAENVSVYGAKVLQIETRVRLRAYESGDRRLTAPCWYESCRPSAVIWGNWQLKRDVRMPSDGLVKARKITHFVPTKPGPTDEVQGFWSSVTAFHFSIISNAQCP